MSSLTQPLLNKHDMFRLLLQCSYKDKIFMHTLPQTIVSTYLLEEK